MATAHRRIRADARAIRRRAPTLDATALFEAGRDLQALRAEAAQGNPPGSVRWELNATERTIAAYRRAELLRGTPTYRAARTNARREAALHTGAGCASSALLAVLCVGLGVVSAGHRR